jgi:hypothetical protein
MKIWHTIGILTAFVLSRPAVAAKLVILTDETTPVKAEQIQRLIKRTAPFSLLKKSELTVNVQVLDSRVDMNCQPVLIKYTPDQIYSLQYWAAAAGVPLSVEDLQRYRDGYTIDRLIQCDPDILASKKVQYGADQMIFVHQSEYEGGSGGPVPVVLSGSREGIGLHEWLHTFGLADEYAYSSEEAPFYCMKHNWPNVAILTSAGPYQTSDEVRTSLSTEIPWLDLLSPRAVLINGDQLGSPATGGPGIFPAKTCGAVPGLTSWKSTSLTTIMEDPGTNYIPKTDWPPILSGLGISDGRTKVLMKAFVKPTWLVNQVSPGNPPPSGI